MVYDSHPPGKRILLDKNLAHAFGRACVADSTSDFAAQENLSQLI